MSKQSSIGQYITKANQTALERIINSDPVLTDVQVAGERFPKMKENWIFHSGPPIQWNKMPGSMRGAIIGALLFEGLAKSPQEAEGLAASSEIEYHPNHDQGGVGGMSGIITRSTPLYIVDNKTYSFTSYSGMLTDRLIFGGYDKRLCVQCDGPTLF